MTMTVSVAAPSRAEGLLAVAIAVAIAVARARPRGRAGVEAEVGGLPAVAGLGRPPAPRHRGGLGAEGHRLAPLATAAGRFPPAQDYLAASRDVAAVAVHGRPSLPRGRMLLLVPASTRRSATGIIIIIIGRRRGGYGGGPRRTQRRVSLGMMMAAAAAAARALQLVNVLRRQLVLVDVDPAVD